jgi:hypothetical protein
MNRDSSYLDLPRRSLYEVCHALGRDDADRACPHCAMQQICLAERLDAPDQALEPQLDNSPADPPPDGYSVRIARSGIGRRRDRRRAGCAKMVIVVS